MRQSPNGSRSYLDEHSGEDLISIKLAWSLIVISKSFGFIMRGAVGSVKYFVVICVVTAFWLIVGDVVEARNFLNGTVIQLFFSYILVCVCVWEREHQLVVIL